ncbi:apyrase, partial [Nephila pilipes]
IREIRSSRDNVLFLNGGDFYQGTVWYTLHRWQIVADLVNTLGIDVMSLGNHEFDDGLKGLFPFLKNLKPKVVVCNINSSKVPEFSDYVQPSTIIEIGGEKIGVIGYLTPETKYLSSTGK